MMKKFFKKTFLIPGLVLFANLILVSSTFAAIVPNPDARKYSLSDVLGILPTAVRFMLGISGSVALFAFIYGGVIFLLSSGNRETVEKGKSVIKGATVGLILVFLSYTIIATVVRTMCKTGECTNWNSWSSLSI